MDKKLKEKNMYLMKDTVITLDRYCDMINAPINAVKEVVDKLNITPRKGSQYNFNDMAKISALIIPRIPVKHQVVSFYMAKGGTGKSSNSFNLSMYLGLLGFKVLMFDIDHQCNLSHQCGLSNDDLYDLDKNIYTVFEGGTICGSIIKVAENIDLIPGSHAMHDIDILLNRVKAGDFIISKKFKDEAIRDKYDFIIVDNNSSPDKASNNFFFVSDCIISSSQPKSNSFTGIDSIIDSIDQVSSFTGRPIVYRILMNFMDSTPDSKMWMKSFKKNFGQYLFSSTIRKSQDFPNSETGKKPFFSFSSDRSNALKDYVDFIDEFIDLTTNRDEMINSSKLSPKGVAAATLE